MTVVAGDILRVSTNFELGDGTQYQNVYSFERNGDDPIADSLIISNIAARMTSMYDELVGFVKDDVTEQLSSIDRLAWTDYHWYVAANIGTFTITFAPTVATDGLPHQVAPYCIFKTARPKTVGKKYLFPFGVTGQEEGILEAPAITAMTAYAAFVLLDVTLTGDAYLEPGVPRTGVEQWWPFTTAVVGDVVGTQRRRRQGVGA